MGAVAPVVGVVGAVAGMAQRNAQVAQSERAARLQIEANNRSHQIKMLDLERERRQQQYAADLEKQQAVANAQLSQLQLRMNEIAERVAIAEQLTSVNFDDAQAQLVAAAQQYDAMLQSFQAEQGLAEEELNRTQEMGQAYSQLQQRNDQIKEALNQGDLRRAQLLSATARQDDTNMGISEAVTAYDANQQAQLESELMTEVMADRAQAEYVEMDEDRAQAFQALLYKINQSQEVSQLAASNLLQADTADKADAARERLEDYRQAVSRIAQLGSQGIDLAKQSSLLQTDINLGYGETARKNAALATGVETASRNAQISASVPKRNWAGGLLNVGMSAMPLLSMRFGGSTNLSGYRPSRFSVGLYQPQQPQALPGFNTFNEAYISSNPVIPRSTGISPVNITPY